MRSERFKEVIHEQGTVEEKSGKERQVGEEHRQSAGGKREEEVSFRKLSTVWCCGKG